MGGADEWVSYTSQWGLAEDTNASGPQCDGYLASQIYAVPQFWYNAIYNVVPEALQRCFRIEDAVAY